MLSDQFRRHPRHQVHLPQHRDRVSDPI
jgi:hypothetical protein